MQVALTGASGFLGRHTVVALVVPATRSHAFRRGTVPDLPDGLDTSLVQGVKADVLDASALEQAFDGAEVVVHGAGFVSNKSRDAKRVYDVHVLGTQNAMAAARAVGAKRLVLVSTSGTVAVGSDPDAMYTEDSPRPIRQCLAGRTTAPNSSPKKPPSKRRTMRCLWSRSTLRFARTRRRRRRGQHPQCSHIHRRRCRSHRPEACLRGCARCSRRHCRGHPGGVRGTGTCSMVATHLF